VKTVGEFVEMIENDLDCEHETARNCEEPLESLKYVRGVANVVNVWSNGKKIRRWAGQGKNSTWHNPRDGYRKMIAILVEVDEEDE
jgi:hypothetical protein